MSFHKLLSVALIAVILMVPAAEAGGLGKAFARAAMGKVLKRDLMRDAATAARPLAKSRKVFRYTTRKQSVREARHGLAPDRHMTARTVRGRPLSPETAQRRYGLPNKPEVRETWKLRSGTPVRSNKALGGTPGTGELTSPRRLSPKDLEKTVPLH
jgi:hypothetical protein